MIGITRIHGKPKEKAPALTPEDLQRMVEVLKKDTSLTALRDNALLQIGFFGALRRSELVNIHYEHITWKKEGIEILLPSSKTDQIHEGQYCAIPYGNELLCPVKALENWLIIRVLMRVLFFDVSRTMNSLQILHLRLYQLTTSFSAVRV